MGRVLFLRYPTHFHPKGLKMEIISKGLTIIDSISVKSGKIVAFLAVPMIIALIYEVTARYIFQKPTTWSYDVTYMIYGTHYLLGSAYTLRMKGHIRIDLLYMKFSPRGRAVIDVVGYLVIFFPVISLLIASSFEMAKYAYQVKEISQFTPWQPILWPFKSVLCLAFILLLLQGIAEFIRSLVMAMGGGEI